MQRLDLFSRQKHPGHLSLRSSSTGCTPARLSSTWAITASIDAWVVLPDHMHCIWTLPAGDADYSNRIGMLKARFSRELGRLGHAPTRMNNTYGAIGGRERTSTEKRHRACPDLRKNESVVWQKRFWEHHIRDEADYLAHLQHCWHNPVKHRLAERPEDWPYSSYHRDKAKEFAA